MSAETNMLRAKYNRTIAYNMELEQKVRETRDELSALEKKYKHLDECTRTLCEEVLKKEREQGSLDKKGRDWGAMPTLELIEMAKGYVADNFGYWKDRLTDAYEMYKKRGEMIEKLKAEIKELKADAGNDKDAGVEPKDGDKNNHRFENNKSVGKTGTDENIGNKKKGVGGKGGRFADAIGVEIDNAEIIEEDADISENQQALLNRVRSEFTGNGKKSGLNAKPAPGRIKAEEERQKQRAQELKEDTKEKAEKILDQMTQIQLQALCIICENKESTLSDTRELTGEATGSGKGTVNTCLKELTALGLVSANTISIPGKPKVTIVTATALGKEAYRQKTGKEPVESEAETLVREHSTLEHGYGIKAVAEMLEQSDFFKRRNAKVSYINGRKPISSAREKGVSIIPDITVEIENQPPMYIEYETNSTTAEDFYHKCNKYLAASNKMYIVVRNQTELEETVKRVEDWIAKTKKEGRAGKAEGFQIMIGAYKSLEASLSATDSKGEKKKPIPDWTRRGFNSPGRR